jgi:hypothetical protein
MRRFGARGIVRGAVAACAASALAGCGSSPITPARIETALQTTFANLVEVQVARLHLPLLAAPDFAATAICRKQNATTNSGAGDWTCALVWQGPDRRMLRDTYDLFVGTDGCFTATAAGESLGGPTLKASDGRDVKSLLYAFEGCFDTM